MLTAEIAPICGRDQQPSPEEWLVDSSERTRRARYAVKKDSRHRARQGYAKHVATRRAKESLRALSCQLAASQPDQRRAYVERRFQELTALWESETGHISSLTDLASHPSYQSIIKLGWDVVPFLLRDLRENSRFWFPALHAITRVRPFDPADFGNGKKMTTAWIQWGIKKGIV